MCGLRLSAAIIARTGYVAAYNAGMTPDQRRQMLEAMVATCAVLSRVLQRMHALAA